MTSPGLLDGPLTAIPMLFLGGVAASLSPCIYPMIPVTAALVGGFASHESHPSRARLTVLTLAYTLGLAIVYATLGLLAGLTGSLFGSVSASPWTSLLTGNLLLVTALATAEVIAIPIPAGVLARSARVGRGGRVAGAATMGAASGLVVAPCSAPIMAGVLTWVATRRNPLLGFGYLLSFSLGMCTLLVGVGISGALLGALPRPGRWMTWTRRAIAAVMLIAAEYYLTRAGQLLS